MTGEEKSFINQMAKEVRVIYFDSHKPDTGKSIPIPQWAEIFLNTFYGVRLKSYSWDRCKIPNQRHHFLYSYHYEQVSHILASMLGFDIDNHKYTFVTNITPYGDFSYCIPKGHYCIQKEGCAPLIMDGRIIVGYNNPYYDEKDEYYRDYPYHKAYLYPHSCSTVENMESSGKTMLVSGDSHFIPQMARLAQYFKEITYLDYRHRKQRKPPTKVYDYLLFAISANHNERHYLKNLGL